MLKKVLSLKIPFALIFSRSQIGDDVFIVVRTSDAKKAQYLNKFQSSKAYAGLSELSLDREDRNYFHSINSPKEWLYTSLGEHGRAYELKERPFAQYIKSTFDFTETILDKEPLTVNSVFSPWGTIERSKPKAGAVDKVHSWTGSEYEIMKGKFAGKLLSQVDSPTWIVWALEGLKGVYPPELIKALKDQYNSIHA